MFWITGILQVTHSSGPWNINTVAYNVTLFVFSELEEMLISYVIIDMDSGHGNEFLIIPNINERKKLASSRRQKKLLSKSESPTVITIQITRWKCLEFEPESKWFGRNWLSIFILSQDPMAIHASKSSSWKCLKVRSNFFYNYVFVMGRDIGILKFVQAKSVIGLITADKMMWRIRTCRFLSR